MHFNNNLKKSQSSLAIGRFTYKKIFLSLALLATTVTFADKFDDIKVLEADVANMQQNIDLSGVQKNLQQNDFQKEIENIYSTALKNVDVEIKKMRGDNVFLEDMKDKATLTQEELDLQKFIKNNKIYVFMSESVPIDIWHTYGKAIYDKKLTNASMVIRGCMGGSCTKLKPTAQFIYKVKDYEKGHTIDPTMMIDPLLFRKYNITKVPCVVFAENAQVKDTGLSEGIDENFNADKIYKSCGAWSLNWHLKEIQKEAQNKDLEHIIEYLEPKGKL